MGISSEIKQVQHLASLGLGAHIVIPEMLTLLGGIIPGAFNSFFWVNERGELTDAYVPYIVPSALAALACLTSDEPTFDKVLAVGKSVGSTLHLHATHDYSRSILRNEVWRPYGIGCALDVVLREGGTPRAILYVNREAHLSRFTARESAMLQMLAPHFLHALDAPSAGGTADEAEERSGTLTVASDGTILAASAEAMQLLLAMSDSPIAAYHQPPVVPRNAFPLIGELLRRQQSIKSGRFGPPARLERFTRWGTFRAKAFAQHAPDGSLLDTLTILISQHLPRAIRLTRQLGSLNLPPREREVAFRMLIGESPDQASAALGISAASLRSYVKRIYQRLGIGSRNEFHALLQTNAQAFK